jgi:hypothetical protein
VAQPFEDESLLEHLRPRGDVEVRQLLGRHADGEAGGDDGAGARPADVVEEVAEAEGVALPAALAQ